MGVDSTVFVPTGPLVAWWERMHQKHQQSNCVCTRGGLCGSTESLRRQVGVSRSTMVRRLDTGQMTMAEADEWAGRLHVHPSRIWPRWDRTPVYASLGTPKTPWNGRVI